MRVSGKLLAANILDLLKREISDKNLSPFLAIILASDNPAPRIYVNRKIEAAELIGVRTEVFEYAPDQQGVVLSKIKRLNFEPSTSGIIVQQPMHEGWDSESFINTVISQKDVDGFLADSPFTPATASAVWEMLSEFARIEGFVSANDFLKDKKIAVLGKGRTAGGPIRKLLQSKGFNLTLIDSKTENRDELIKNADVIISATGVKNIIRGDNITPNSYVIGIGVGKENGVTFGDIEEESVSQRAKLYCPTIGGIGPLTVACLLRNVVLASVNTK